MRASLFGILAALLTLPARAQPPDELFDPLKFLEYDLYDSSPEDQAAWEAGRYANQAVRLDLGSVTLKELFAIQEAQVNLPALPWLSFHADLRDDNTREAEVARLSGDMFVRVAEGVELAASGSPDVWKDRGAWGGGALLVSRDRTRYALLRLLDDRPLYNGKNLEGGRRDTLVWRAQAEVREALGAWSLWMRADLGTRSEIRYPSAPPQGVQSEGDQRSDVDAHLRWEGAAAAGLRFTARRLDSDRVAQAVPDELRRGSGFARAYLLAPLAPRVKLRAVALFAAENARGLDAGSPYTFSRLDLGGRAGAVVQLAPLQFTLEAGWAAVRSAQNFSPGGIAVGSGSNDTRFAEKGYVSAQWRPSARIYLRFLLSRQLWTGRFGGMNGEIGAQF